MARFNSEWVVAPHGPLIEIEPGLLTVDGDIVMPLGNFPRRMTVVGLTGGRTAIWSAMSLGESEMAVIEELGRPSFLIVPGIAHRLDLRAWKNRYPDAKVIAAPGAKAAVEEVCPVDATEDVLGDKEVSFQTVAGTGGKEAALVVTRPGGVTLLLNDVLANVQHPRGTGAKIMARLMGFGVDRPKMPWLGKRLFVTDKAALAAAFQSWAAIPNLRRVIVSHGDVIEIDSAGVLSRIARELA